MAFPVNPQNVQLNGGGAGDLFSAFNNAWKSARADVAYEKDRRRKDELYEADLALQKEIRAALDAGDMDRAGQLASLRADPDKALEFYGQSPDRLKKTVEADGEIAKQVAPFAKAYLGLPDAESRATYVRTNRALLKSKGVSDEVLTALETDPMNPGVEAVVRGYADAGYDYNSHTNRINAETGQTNARYQKMGEGETMFDTQQRAPVYGTPKDDQDHFNPGIADPRTGGGLVATGPAPTTLEGAAAQIGMDPKLVGANPYKQVVMGLETPNQSDYQSNGQMWRSPKGAMGRMQVMPETARDPGFGIRPWDGKSMDDLARVGDEYLVAMQREFGGDPKKVLAAYNAGPGRVKGLVARYGDDWLAHAPKETQDYVAKGLTELGGAGAPQAAAPTEVRHAGGWVSKQRQQKPTANWQPYSNPSDPNGTYQREETTGQIKKVSSAPKPAGPQAKPNDILNTRTKYRSTFRLEKQLDALEQQAGKVAMSGPILGRVPYGELEGDADAYDKAVAAVTDTITALTRIPGIGAQSDYEARLKAATLPGRDATAAGRAQAIKDLRLLISDLRKEYGNWLKQYGGEGGAAAPSSGSKTVVRTGKTKDGRKVVQYSDGSIEYGN